MTSGDIDETDLTWALGSWSSTPGTHDVTLSRPVSVEARDELLAAAEFVRTFGSGFGFNRVIVAVRDFIDRAHTILEKGTISDNELTQIQRSFLIAAQLVSGVPVRIETALEGFRLPADRLM